MAGTVEVALRWCTSREARVLGFANSRPTDGDGWRPWSTDTRNAAVRACVGQAVQVHLRRWLDGHPEQAAAIVGRIIRGAHRR